MSRFNRLILLLGSTVALTLVVIGIPVALIYLVGWPFPSPLPTSTELGDMAAGRTPIPVDYLIDVLGLVMWIIWAQIAWAAVIEIIAAARGGLAKRARMLPGVQTGVARLVTGAAFLATSLAVRPVAAGPLVPVAVGLADDSPLVNAFGANSALARTGATGPGIASATTDNNNQQVRATAYMTETGDTWWGIAADKLGSGTRWKELRSINLGRTMEDGTVISSSTDLLRPNWRLLMPSPRPITVSSDGIRTVTVEPGDTIWGIAEDDLDDPSMAELVAHADDISSMNESQLDGNPDLIHPGQKLDLPPLVSRGESTASDDDWEEIDRSDPDSTLDDGQSANGETSEPASADPPVSPALDPGPRLPAPVEVNVLPEPNLELETADAPSLDPEPATDTAESATGSIGRSPDQTPPSVIEVQPQPDTEPEVGLETEPETDVATSGPLTPVLDLDTGGTFPTTMPSLEEGAPSAGSESETENIGPLPQTSADELTDAEVAAASLAGQDEALDTDSSRAPVFAGLAALTLIGGYLYRARGRRRDTSLRHRHPGRMPQPPKRRTRGIARRLAAAAQPEHPEFVNVGLRALGRQLQGTSPKQLPKISGVWVSHNRLVIALADDSPHGVPPTPFMEFADGSGWSLRRADFEEARDIAAGSNGPLPLLTTLGTTSALDLALTTNSRAPADAYGLSSALLYAVDLEAGRVISVQARDESSTVEALTMMALELATSDTADQVEIVLVGFGHRLATFDRVTVVDEVAEILDDLETITSRAVYASADASPFATRVGNGAADTWDPVVVFHADSSDSYSETLIELAAKTEGGVTAVCGYQTDVGWTMHVDGEKVRCADLPGDLSRHEFIRPKLDGVDLVADLFDEPWSDVEIDEEFWAPMDDSVPDHTWYLADDDEPSWRPMGSVTESDRRQVPEHVGADLGPIDHLGGDSRSLDQMGSDQGESAISTVDRWDLPPAPPTPTSIAPPRFSSPPDFEPPPLRLVKDNDRGDDGQSQSDLDDDDPTEPEWDSWPGSETPVLKDLQHSVVLGPVSTEPELTLVSDPPADDVDEPPAADSADEAPADEAPADEPAVDEPLADESSAEEFSTDEPAAEQPPSEEPLTEEPPAEELSAESPVAEEPSPEEPDGADSTAVVLPAAQARAVDDHDRAQTGLQISVLGEFTINGWHIGDRAKPWKYTKTPELILYLLLHPGGASQDLLMEQLFPEQPPNRPRLNQLVSDARTKALGQNDDGDYHLPHASPTEPFYKLLPSISLDLRDFARHCARAKTANGNADLYREMAEWKAALTLVEGRPFTLPHDGYEWALPEIEATIVKVEEAAMALADLALDIEDYELAVWATKQGLLTGTGYYELLVKRGRAALLLQDPEEIVRAFADLQVSLDYTGAPEEHTPDLSMHPELEEIYNELSSEGRGQDRP
jgi:LysM repeat protein